MYYRFYRFKVKTTLVGGIETVDGVVTHSSRLFEWATNMPISKLLEFATANNFRVVTYESKAIYTRDKLLGICFKTLNTKT